MSWKITSKSPNNPANKETYGLGPRTDKRKRWMGSKPEACDLCQAKITSEFVDGAIRGSSWANMCCNCHGMYGVGLGTGRGQHYVKDDDGVWYKVEG